MSFCSFRLIGLEDEGILPIFQAEGFLLIFSSVEIITIKMTVLAGDGVGWV